MIIRNLNMQDYQETWRAMRQFTQERLPNTEDELWLLEHNPVYTQGKAGKAEHILNSEDIPIIQTDRGGQVTYHGPGQLVCYVLMDLAAKKIGIKSLVCKLEQSIINMLQEYNIDANRKDKAPGVYVSEKKIASIGLRVKNNYTYHGIAINVDLDLKPFDGINPCGFPQLKMTKISDYYPSVNISNVQQEFTKHFRNIFQV